MCVACVRHVFYTCVRCGLRVICLKRAVGVCDICFLCVCGMAAWSVCEFSACGVCVDSLCVVCVLGIPLFSVWEM